MLLPCSVEKIASGGARLWHLKRIEEGFPETRVQNKENANKAERKGSQLHEAFWKFLDYHYV